MRWLSELWAFLGRYQSATVRALHAAVVLAIIVQLLDSNGMHFDKATGAVGSGALTQFSTWLHIGLGLALLPLSLVFIGTALASHGPRHYFPYLWGDLTQAKADIAATLKLQLTEPRPGGLAAIVTGLGMGALLLVVGSGAIWFLLWRSGSLLTRDAKEVHEALAGLLEWYVVGHGGMATLHFFSWLKTTGRDKSARIG